MTDFVNFIRLRAKKAKKRFDTSYEVDTTDRIKYVYSIIILCTGAVLYFAKQYVGQPVQCWAPKQFSSSWEQYAETYCLIENTYFVPMNGTNLPKHEQRYQTALIWYQWVPVILALEALLLYLPRFLWKVLQKFLGVSMAIVTVHARNHAKKTMTKKFESTIDAKRIKSGWKWGYKMTAALLVSKFVSIIVIFFQIFSLDWIIFGNVLYPYGLSVIVDLVTGKQWHESGAFPRVTFCDFEVRELGQVHKWSLQCVLMINMYNEKIFIFIWWWLVILLTISFANLIKWLLRITPGRQDSFVERVIRCCDPADWVKINEFRRKVLYTDGVTLLHLIEENATIYEAADFIMPLFEDFTKENEKKER